MLACWAWLATAAAAQAPGTGSGVAPAGGIDSDPIACWWKTDTSAVYVGEQFRLTLTCSVVDTADGRVVADTDRLDPAALDVAPFEVIDGTRHRDIQAPPRRYFQYSYTVRLLGDEYFGQDVDIPSIAITYNSETLGTTGARGRDQLYLLPSLPVRVLSLVPRTATDIQDASPETFDDIDRRAFRAAGELVAAGVLFTFALAFAGLTVVRLARPRVAPAAIEAGLPSPVLVLRGCIREAARVKAETERTGWSLDLVDGSLTVFRIAGAVALGRSVARRVVDRGVAPEMGQLRMRTGALTAQRVLISGSTTAATVAARLAGGDAGAMDARLRMTLEEVGESLRVFAAVRYGREGELDGVALDAAFDTGVRALRRLYALKRWPARTAAAAWRAVDRLKDVAWRR